MKQKLIIILIVLSFTECREKDSDTKTKIDDSKSAISGDHKGRHKDDFAPNEFFSHSDGHPPYFTNQLLTPEIGSIKGMDQFRYIKEIGTGKIFAFVPKEGDPTKVDTPVKFEERSYYVAVDGTPSRLVGNMKVTLGYILNKSDNNNGIIAKTPRLLENVNGFPAFNLIEHKKEKYLAQDEAINTVNITRKSISYTWTSKLEKSEYPVYYHLRNIFFKPIILDQRSVELDLCMAIDLTYVHVHGHPNGSDVPKP